MNHGTHGTHGSFRGTSADRITCSLGGVGATSYPDPDNRIHTRYNNGRVGVLGVADPAALVSAAFQPLERHNSYFAGRITVDNSAGPVYTNIVVRGLQTNSSQVLFHQSYSALVPKGCETNGVELLNDDDGNPTQDSLWSYAWDGENRLIRMTTRLPDSDLPAKRIEFQYDWLGRRVAKHVYGSATGGTPISSYFLYDGWNLIAIVNASKQLTKSFVWGLDLSGTEQGAGGVGGLLMFNDHSSGTATYAAGGDAKGNVMLLVNAASGAVAARYEYGPYGEPIRLSGESAGTQAFPKLNPFRFSTKFTDDESGLLYYGYRYYQPYYGRWLNRDPLGEAGGINLYAFCGNDPVNWTDTDGLAPQNWTVGDYIKQDRPDPTSPTGWRGGNGSFIPAPESPGSLQQTPRPAPPSGIGVPNNQSVGSKKGDTAAGAAAGGLDMAANMMAAGLEQMQVNRLRKEGLDNCQAEAKKEGGCGGCCLINLYLVTGKRDSYRNVFSPGSHFYDQPCFMVQASMDRITGSVLEPYFGRWGCEHNRLYRFVHPDAGEKVALDHQRPIPVYIDMSASDVKE